MSENNEGNTEYVGDILPPGSFGRDNDWPVYNIYELRHSIEGEPCIAPKTTSKLTRYFPFEHYPQILIDFLSLGSKLSNEIYDLETLDDKWYIHTEDVMKFVKKYGLPGEFSKRRQHAFADSDGKIMLVAEPLEETGKIVVLPYKDYIRPYFCPAKKGANNIESLNEPVIDPVTGDLLINEELELKWLGEPVKRIIRKIVEYYDCINTLQYMKRENFDPEEVYIEEEGYQVLWKEEIEINALVRNVHMTMAYSNGKWKYKFLTTYLFDYLLILALEESIYHMHPLIFCRTCGRIIHKRHPWQKHCGGDQSDSYQCGNVSRQRRFRERKKEALRQLKEGKSEQEVAEKFNTGVDTIKRWLNDD